MKKTITLLLLFVSFSSQAEIFKCVKDGQIHYSNDRCSNAKIVETSSNNDSVVEHKCSTVLTGLPSNMKKNDGAELHVINIHEGPVNRSDNLSDITVNVHVRRAERPLILALLSYERVVWNLTVDKGAVVQEVILSSPHSPSQPSFVVAKNENIVKPRIFNKYAFERCSFNSYIAAELQEFSGHDIESFQGAYSGSEFVIQTRSKNDKKNIASIDKGESQLPQPFLADKTSTNTPFKSGLEAFQNEQYAEATKLFKKALAKEPDATASWYFLGESLAKIGKTDNALCAFYKIIDLHQSDSSESQAQTDIAIAGIQRLSEKYTPSAPLDCKKILSDIQPLPSNDIKSLQDKMKSCDSKIAISAAEAFIANQNILTEPLELFSPAAVLFQNGKKDDAVFWFYAAQLRVRYQLVFEKGDRGQLLTVMMMTVGVPINNNAFQDVSNFIRTLDRVLEWDKRTPNPFRNKPRTVETDKQIEQIYAGFEKLKAKIVAEKSELESKARAAAPMIEQSYTQRAKLLCGKGKIDPSDANQIIKKEWLLVLDFVKNNKDVIREVGTIKGVGRESSTMKQGEIIPSRYIVTVGGDRSAYAVIDVSRITNDTKFSLACLTHLSLGQRDPFKDVCKQ